MQAKTLLLATDLSPASVAALPHAARLAWATGAEVVVATVATRVEVEADGGAGLRRLEAFREALTQMDVRARSILLDGARAHAEDVLLRYAREESVDAIVVTRHGERAEAGHIGSSTVALARTSPVPVLVAHGPASHSPSEAVRPAEWKRLLAATDFSEAASITAHRAADLARQLQGELELLTVLVDARCPLDVGPNHVHFAKMPSDLATWARDSGTRLDALAGAIGGVANARVVAAEDAAAGIVGAALQDNVDLLVVAAGSRGPIEYLFLGSTTEAVLRLSPLPVLVLRGRLAD